MKCIWEIPVKEYFNLTIEDAVYHYVVNPCWQYALNVNPATASMSHSSIERYSRYFRESALAQKVFHRVTSALIDILELDVSRQRLDSTHIYSDMGTFGRAKLMGVAIRRFLKQLKRHEQALFDQLRPEVQQHCTVSESKLFGDLQSPVSGVMPGHPGDLTIDNFVIDETSHEVQRCPTGHTLLSSQYDSEQDQTVTEMDPCSCGTCDFKDQCPVKQVRDRYIVTHTPAQRRLAVRRAEQSTVVFAENYSISGGGESVNSCLKRKTGMGHLRVRGRPNMELGIFLRCAGWNLSRAVAALRKSGISDFWGLLCHLLGLSSHFGWVQCEGKANRARGLVLKSVGNPKCQ